MITSPELQLELDRRHQGELIRQARTLRPTLTWLGLGSRTSLEDAEDRGERRLAA